MGRKIFILIVILLSTVFQGAASEDIPYIFVKNYSIEDYRASCQNWGFSLTSNGTLYVANNSGLLIFDGNSWTLYRVPNKEEVIGVTNYGGAVYTLSPSAIYEWRIDNKGIFEPKKVDHTPQDVNFFFKNAHLPFPIPKEIEEKEPTVITTNGKYFFIGTNTNGLYILNRQGDILINLSLKNQLQDNIVRAIALQDNNILWLALDNGISQVTLDPSLFMIGKRSDIGKLENGILENGFIYIKTSLGVYKKSATNNSPLTACNPEEVRFNDYNPDSLNVKDIFPNSASLKRFVNADQVYEVAPHMYWLVLSNEAALFHEEEGMGTLICRLLFDNYNINLITRGRKIFPLNENLLLLSTMQGAYLVNIRDFIGAYNVNPIPLEINRLEYQDKKGKHYLPIKERDITLPHDFKAFSADIGTTIFTSNHHISYKIDGVSDEWSKWQEDGTVSFLQLPEGVYKLVIRKYVVRGPYPEIALTIEVAAPWYNTIWAWIIYILIGWIIVHISLLFYQRSLRKEEQERLDKEKQLEQQRLSELKREMLETEIQNKNNELTLQTSTLVKRNQAIQGLLEELEKQKETLGDRYPNKLYNKMKTMMEENLNNQADWIQFESYFNSTHQNFIERLRQQYPDLTSGDLRICCFLRMNLSTKEISSLLNISVRAIELRRYRMRKRLALEGDVNLVDFLMNF